MGFKLKPTSTTCTFKIGDKSGYRYEINTHLDGEWGGHSASVIMSSSGMATPERAVEHLRFAAEHFLRQLSAATDEPVA